MVTYAQIRHSAGLYPLTSIYLVAATELLLVSQAILAWQTAAILLALVAVIAVLVATRTELQHARIELHTVHTLVNSQRTELLQRIDRLTGLLEERGMEVPPDGPLEQDARSEHAAGLGKKLGIQP